MKVATPWNILLGDLNSQITNNYLCSFLYQHELSSIVKESTCFKNVSNSSYRLRRRNFLETFF